MVLESLPEALAGMSVPISSFWRMVYSLPLRGFESCALSFSHAEDVLNAQKGISQAQTWVLESGICETPVLTALSEYFYHLGFFGIINLLSFPLFPWWFLITALPSPYFIHISRSMNVKCFEETSAVLWISRSLVPLKVKYL